MDKKQKHHITGLARSRGNMIVCVSIILERTDVPRTCAVVIVRVQVKASDLTGHLTASFIGRQLVKP